MKRLILVILFLCLPVFGQYGSQTVKPMLGRQVNWANPLSKGLVGYWLMNQGTGIYIQDLSGNGRRGLTVGPTWTVGKYGPALLFTAASNNRVGFDSEIIGAGGCSIVALINPASIGETTGRIVDNGKTIFFCASTNRLGFSSNGSITTMYSADNSVPYNVWSHVVVTRKALADSSEGNFYVNGVLAALANKNSGLPAAGTATLKIGSNDNFSRDFDGKIEFVCIYNRVLSATEVAQLYREPFAMFHDTDIWWLYSVPAGGLPGQVIIVNGD